MKKITSLFLICIACLSIEAQISQGITSRCNYFRSGDKLTKQQVEYKDPGPYGKNILWDFSMLNSIDEKYQLNYFNSTVDDSTHIVGMEHLTRYHYELKNDTLWMTNYENRTTQMTFDKPEAQLRYPFRYGDSLHTTFTGTGIYCQKINLTAKGETSVTVDATGFIITPTKDTLNNVLRVKRFRNYTRTGVDSVRMQLETFTWYAQGYRYPVFETVKSVILRGDSASESFTTAFYYPIDDLQNLAPDPANENVSSGDAANIYSVFTEVRLMPNPVVDNLNVNFKLTRPAKVWFTVHNNTGVPLCQTSPENLEEGYHNTSIKMSNLITGVYSIYVHVDDRVMRLNVLKK
jgi:hypothetical protein